MTTTADLIAPTSRPNNEIATSGPLREIAIGDAIATAEGVSPYLLAAVGAVKSGDNAEDRIHNDANYKDGARQVNSGVWNSPNNPGRSKQIEAKQIKI